MVPWLLFGYRFVAWLAKFVLRCLYSLTVLFISLVLMQGPVFAALPLRHNSIIFYPLRWEFGLTYTVPWRNPVFASTSCFGHYFNDLLWWRDIFIALFIWWRISIFANKVCWLFSAVVIYIWWPFFVTLLNIFQISNLSVIFTWRKSIVLLRL